MLKKGYLRPQNIINKYRLVTGVILGTFFSYVLYSFFYCFREALRILTGQLGTRSLIELTSKENFYYNFFYASIASIIGLYIIFKFTFEISINYTDKKVRLRQLQILNDQVFFNWNFLNVFVKITSILGILYWTFSIQYDINFYEDFKFILPLIPVILFLNLWPIVLRTIGKKSYKWIFYSCIYTGVISLVYANINYIDYKKVNKKLRSLEEIYNLQVPESKSHELIRRMSLMTNIYIVNDSIAAQSPLIFWDEMKTAIGIEEITEYSNLEKARISDLERDELTLNLHIDRNVKLQYVNQVKEELRGSHIRNIQYSTGVKNSKYPSNYPYFKYLGIQQILFPIHPEMEALLDSAEIIDFSKYRLKIPKSYKVQFIKGYNRVAVHVSDQTIFLNGQEIARDRLEELLLKFIRKYAPNFVIIYDPDEEISYGRYIEYMDFIFTIIDELRDEMSYKLYQQPYDPGYGYKDMTEVSLMYPRNVIEWSPMDKRLINMMRKGIAQ